MNYFKFDEIKWLCAFTKHTTQTFIKKNRIDLSELVLTPFSPFDIKLVNLILNAKNLMQKTSGNVFLGHLVE